MPGTPVIYYGDEIGMGDNIHLGDRDGVRTPMQWSEDRNGGFSRADPSAVVLPPVMDPLYGYAAVNVEAQARDPHSLLNWMRRMLLLRSKHQAFGRGSITFLYPSNRRVLAYVRQFEGKTLLCVANLSRTPQAVELDLSAYAGMVPIEITGPSPFPPIGRLDYLLTLQPFSFYWFDLQGASEGASLGKAPSDLLPEYQTLVVRESLRELMSERHTATILRDILPGYLKRRRWFAAKNEAISDIRFVYSAPLLGLQQNDVYLNEIEVTAGKRVDRYMMPAVIVWDDISSPTLAQQLAIARVRRGRRVGVITDGFASERLPRAIIAGLLKRRTLESADGVIHFNGSDRLDELPDMSTAPIRWLSAEQSNSSLLIGSFAMLKLIRRVVPGIHPEAEMTRYLTEAGYRNATRLLGEVVRVAQDGTPHTLIIVQSNIENQGDAWDWMLDTLNRTIEDAVLKGTSEAATSPFAGINDFVATIGTRLAEMHIVLAQPTENPDFSPVEVDDAVVANWVAEVEQRLTVAFDQIARVRESLEGEAATLADAVVSRRDRLIHALPKLASAGLGGLATRVHGDFHLGQILVSQPDAYIIDFEGEPIKSLAERRAKTTPLRDVAGLLRSLDYAVASVEKPDNDASLQPVRAKRAELLSRFRSEAAAAFLIAYWQTAATAPDMRLDPERNALLDLMLVEKAAYEIAYEAANRPGWLPIPLRGLADLSSRLQSGGPRAQATNPDEPR
jgi:maltose alpha-D-glucosyltransferase/alpha-amylase